MATELELAHVTPMDKAREYLGLSWDEFCDYVDQGEVTPYLLRRKDGNRRLFVRFFGHKGGWPNPGYFKYDCGTYGTVFFDCDELRKFLDTFATQKDEEEAFTCPEQASMTPPTVQGAVSTYAGNYGGYYYGAMQEYTGYQTGQATWPAYTATQRPQPMEPPKPMTQAPMAPKPATPLQTPEPLPPTPAPAPTPLPSPIGRQEEAQDNARVAELEEQLARAQGEIERLQKENQDLRRLAEKSGGQGQGVDAKQAEELEKVRKELETEQAAHARTRKALKFATEAPAEQGRGTYLVFLYALLQARKIDPAKPTKAQMKQLMTDIGLTGQNITDKTIQNKLLEIHTYMKERKESL